MRHLAWMTLLFLGTIAVANASEYRLKLVLDPAQAIPRLRWDLSPATQGPILEIEKNTQNEVTYFVTLKGTYLGHDSSLLYLNQRVPTNSQGIFAIKVPVVGEKQEFSVLEVDSLGDVKAQQSELLFPEWKALMEPAPHTLPKKNYSLSPGIGFTTISYQQSGWPGLVEFVLTGKLSADYSLGDHWDIGANLFGTVLPLFANPAGNTIQFFGGNLKTGYKVSLSSQNAWVLKILAGYYFSTTVASTSGIGYQNVQGPELYPSLTYHFSNGKAAWLYFKFSPVMNSISFLDLSSFETAVGGGFLFLPMGKGRGLGATLDVASLKLLFTGRSIVSTSYTLGINFRF